PLEGRTVPSTVTATTDARPLVFELRGNVTNDQAAGTGDSRTTNHYDGVVTATGTLNYTSDTQGASDTAHATGAGTGLVTVGSGDASGQVTDDGTVHVTFTVKVTGALMKAASEDAAAATVTATWEGDVQKVGEDPQSADAGFAVPISWNAGTVHVDVTGLTK